MEGPSLFLAAEQLAPFVGLEIEHVLGNTKIGKERLLGKKILRIFSYGKQLFFQFDTFALRVHFLLWGSFEAVLNTKRITGDYPRRARISRLTLELPNGRIDLFSCSLRFVESENVMALCDFSNDIMAKEWDPKQALLRLKENSDEEIGDVLLDQAIFNGVGNIIKNEVLLLVGLSPIRTVKEIKLPALKKLISTTRKYVFQFYEWRKIFELKKNYRIYRQKSCKQCGCQIVRVKTGKRKRWSYICENCEK